ncbi:MAG: S41 family peptidase [Fibrobacteria bacterium]
MPVPRQLFGSALALSLTALVGGCIFDSVRPSVPASQVSRSRSLDTVLSPGVHPDTVVPLFQPLLDGSLKPGAVASPEALPSVNVRDHVTKKIVQYQVTRQRFGSWSAELEFKWNYFLLRGNFLFPEGLPDTAGLDWKTQTLYEKVHPEDAFTNYFDSIAAPAIWTRITTSTKPGAIGVAVKLSHGGDSVLIQLVVPNSPAGRAGLAPGMAIVAVNDSATVGDSALQRFQRFSLGDSGSMVKLLVTDHKGVATYTLVREPVAFPTVLIDSIQGVGYLSINAFTPNTVDSKSTYTELRDGLIATRRFPVTILDLRDNGGGSLDIALRMCDEIVPEDTVIIRQLQRRYDEAAQAPLATEIAAIGTSGGVGEKAPDGSRRKYLLLGNANSASASEIFLVAVKEGVNAPLMGVKTYGKGVGQTVRNTPGKGLALVTFLKFTSRTQLDYHKHGLQPDIVDTSETDQLLANAATKALEMSSGLKAKKASASGFRDLALRAAAVEWNRRQAVRPGVRDIDGVVVP